MLCGNQRLLQGHEFRKLFPTPRLLPVSGPVAQFAAVRAGNLKAHTPARQHKESRASHVAQTGDPLAPAGLKILLPAREFSLQDTLRDLLVSRGHRRIAAKISS